MVQPALSPEGLMTFRLEHSRKHKKYGGGLVSLLAEIEAALRLFGTMKELKLSQEEKELLKAARDGKDRNQGVFAQMPGDMDTFPYIQAGDTHFTFDDPRMTAKYRQAFANLIKRGYVEHQGGIIFILTADGWDAADKLD